MPPQATVIFASGVIHGSIAGLTVIVLLTEANVLWHASVAVQVSVTVPPQAPGVAVNVDEFEVPAIAQPSVRPLLYGMVLEAGMPPQATVIFASGVIVGNAAGLTVMVLLTGASGLLHGSVAVHVSVTVPPQGPGVAVNVEEFEVPAIWQPSERVLLYGMVLGAGTPPQATVIFASGVIVGNCAGLTVMVLLTEVNALWH